jgi:hypothetical protein
MSALSRRFSSWPKRIVLTHVVMTHFVTMTSGCLYDWEVGQGASSGSSSGSSSSSSSSGTVENDAGPDCAALTQALDAARAKAKACMFAVPMQCTASITDERGCKSWVNDGTSQEAQDFSAAISAFSAAGCMPSSESCLMSAPTCLFVAGKPVCVP